MQEIVGNPKDGRFVSGQHDSRTPTATALGGLEFRPEMLTSRRTSASNVNQMSAWRGAAFRFVQGEAA